ncbi:MAG: flagellar hook protein [Naasia sp.]|nr:flagellar hook protein [Naasia sp.]
MLRSLYSGISGLRAHQAMLDVTGNNIANVNTTAFKGSNVLFQDTLSQMVTGARLAGGDIGGSNPSQVGLGVQVAGISTNLTQGSTQSTGRNTDMMISGDGYFVTRSAGETLYTRAGAFNWDSLGRLTSPDGGLLQGWTAVNGEITTGGTVGPILIPLGTVSPAKQTNAAAVSGNLPSDSENGTVIKRDVQVFDEVGNARTLSLSFTFSKADGSWAMSATDGTSSDAGTLEFTDGVATGGTELTVGNVRLDLASVSSFAQLKTVGIVRQDGQPAGSLQSFNISSDGTLVGSFSNGATEPLARLALATFVNPSGMEKAGGSSYRASVNSGDPVLGVAGSDGFGGLAGGALEMSNVDLSAEFTNLIVAQRGFQANARIITTSDEVLQELTNLKR